MASNIAKFYAGRSVFLTGGSGFVGKQIIEKLLRSCPEIDKIYLLMRSKKGHNIQQRLKNTLDSPVFDLMRETQPDFSRKIIPVAGEVRHDFLGISDADHSRMSADVSIVIHSAATLSFIEPLKVAVDMNVLGVRRCLDVCKQLPRNEALVHISTAYSQINKRGQLLEEKIYDPPISPEKAIALVRMMTDGELEALTSHLLKTHQLPNTYTLTKAIAEKLVEQEHGQVPVCIIRPSIVTASQAEPFPGWVDNTVAANGIYAAYGTGLLRCVLTGTPKGTNKLDFVPVDRVANQVVVAAWHTATSRSSSVETSVPVYNITSKGLHSVGEAAILMTANARRYPYSKLHPARYALTGYPPHTYNRTIYSFFKNIYNPVKFLLYDFSLAITGQKPRLSALYKRTTVLLDVLEFFTTNDFNWQYNRMMKIYNALPDADKKEFNCLVDEMDKEKYYKDWWYGMKKYVFKDPTMNKKQQAPAIQQKPDDLAVRDLK